jgi:hypothetical protein
MERSLVLHRKAVNIGGTSHYVDIDHQNKTLCGVDAYPTDFRTKLVVGGSVRDIVPCSCKNCEGIVTKKAEHGVVSIARVRTKPVRKSFAVTINGRHRWFWALEDAVKFAKDELMRLVPNCNPKIKNFEWAWKSEDGKYDKSLETRDFSVDEMRKCVLEEGKATLSAMTGNTVAMVFGRSKYDDTFPEAKWDRMVEPEILPSLRAQEEATEDRFVPHE